MFVAYTDESNAPQTATGQAGGSGGYQVDISALPLLGSQVTVRAGSNQLYARKQTEVIEDVDRTLRFTVPAAMPFGTVAISPPGTLHDRQDNLWSIEVNDGRSTKAAWNLQVRVASPLTADFGGGVVRTLEDALVYMDNDQPVQLGAAAYTVLVQPAADAAQVQANWAADEGILFRMPSQPVYAAPNYTATLEWILADGP